MNLAADLSYYQWFFPYDEASEFLSRLIPRISFAGAEDKRFRFHAGAWQKTLEGFTWYDPYVDVKKQIETVRTAIHGTRISRIWVDVEQHGVSYKNLPPYVAPAKLSTGILSYVTGLETMGIPVGTYTRSTWVWAHCRPMLDWMYSRPVWLASYPYASGLVNVTWQSLIDDWAPKKFSPYFVPDWPEDLRRADIWQFSGDKFVLPGVQGSNSKPIALDIDWVFEEEGAGPAPEPELSDSQKLEILWQAYLRNSNQS